MNHQMHQIGEVAAAVGLSLRTIRHYEEVDLVPPSGRTAGGFRLYTDDDIERLRLVKRMKPLDFSLEEMRELLTILDGLAGDADDETETALIDRLAGFADAAEERCQRLRARLEAAEGLAELLRRESVDRRRPAPSRR